MEENGMKKDKTPYLIFACKRCQHFSYVKTTQKTKRCLRCGCSFQVKNLVGEGEIVHGITQAVNTVKRRQNELTLPGFRSQGDFIINTSKTNSKSKAAYSSRERIKNETGTEIKFKALLHELSNLYGEFPAYMIEIMGESSGISNQELQDLIKTFKKQGSLVQLKNEDFYYKISRNL